MWIISFHSHTLSPLILFSVSLTLVFLLLCQTHFYAQIPSLSAQSSGSTVSMLSRCRGERCAHISWKHADAPVSIWLHFNCALNLNAEKVEMRQTAGERLLSRFTPAAERFSSQSCFTTRDTARWFVLSQEHIETTTGAGTCVVHRPVEEEILRFYTWVNIPTMYIPLEQGMSPAFKILLQQKHRIGLGIAYN